MYHEQAKNTKSMRRYGVNKTVTLQPYQLFMHILKLIFYEERKKCRKVRMLFISVSVYKLAERRGWSFFCNHAFIILPFLFGFITRLVAVK